MEVVSDSVLKPTARMQKTTQSAGYDVSMMPKLNIS
jgi:hypothetical protein